MADARSSRQKSASMAAPIRGMQLRQLIGEQVRQHRRTMRLVRVAATTLAALTAISVAATVVAISQRDHAVSQSDIAQSDSVAAQATNLFPADDRWRCSSVWKLTNAPTQLAASVLLQATQQPLDVLLESSSTVVTSVAFSPNGQILAAGSDGGSAGLWDVAAGRARGFSSLTIANSW
jgi:hypothetical protein